MRLFQLVKRSIYFWLFFGFAMFLCFTLKSFSGSASDLIFLDHFSNITFSAALFFIAIPAFSVLSIERFSSRFEFFMKPTFIGIHLCGLLSLTFIFSSTQKEYFGLEKLPESELLIFVFLMVFSFITALSSLFIWIGNFKNLKTNQLWAALMMFSAVGLGAALLGIQFIVKLGDNGNFANAASMVLAGMIKNLIFISIILSISDLYLFVSKSHKIIAIIACVLLIPVGIHSIPLTAGYEISSLDILYSFSALIGFISYFLVVFLCSVRNFIKGSHVLASGLVTALSLLMVFQIFPISTITGNGLFNDFRFSFAFYLLPILLAMTKSQKSNSLNVSMATVSSLFSISLILITYSTFVLDRSLGSMTQIGITGLSSEYSLFVFSVSIMGLGVFIYLWNHFLELNLK